MTMINSDLNEKVKCCLTDFHNGNGPEDFPSLMEDYVLTYHKLLYRTVFCKYFFPVFADTFCSSHPGEFTCNFSLKNF